MDSRTNTVTCDQKPAAKKISLESLEASITAYYDGLSDAEVEEDKIWGEFAGLSPALEEDEALQV